MESEWWTVLAATVVFGGAFGLCWLADKVREFRRSKVRKKILEAIAKLNDE